MSSADTHSRPLTNSERVEEQIYLVQMSSHADIISSGKCVSKLET